jgi:transcriptional regulator with AAA-type ATPase domain/tetratricopeptide (TPR) repeat protein
MDPLGELLGDSAPMVALRQRVRGLLDRQTGTQRLPPILIQGETGTGKGLLARIMHRAGRRASGPFVDVNCAAIPETLLESELFGHERGAFTDARQSKPGLFHTANGGTLFLDEVGLLPRALQAKLLTVLEQRAVRRLGATRSEPVNVAIVAATNEDLALAVKHGRFREDLYHRLAVLTLALPPLRERPDDVALLAEHALARVCADYGLPPRELSADAREALRAHDWPGNVRELSNVIERAALLTDTRTLTAEALRLPGAVDSPGRSGRDPGPEPDDASVRDRLAAALRETGGNITRTAIRLGITRNTVRAWIRRHALDREGAAPPASAAGNDTTAGPEPGIGAKVAPGPGVRWSRRRVMFLRARVIAGPEDRSPARTRLLDRLVEKVDSFGGRVDELGRDGVLATFGTEPAEDAPRRAANAALAMRRAIEREHEAGHVPADVFVGIGLHVGLVLVAQLGARHEIDSVHRIEAGRALDVLEPLPADAIAVSEAAAGLLERHFALRAREEGRASGALVVARDPRAAPAAALVGRSREVETLAGQFDRAMDGRGQVVTVVGEPGIGKSRIVREFRETVHDDTTLVVEGRCVAYGVNVPYVPLLEILRGILGLDETDEPDALGEGVRAGLDRLGPDAHAWAPYVEALLDPRRTGALPALSPEALKTRTFEAIQQLVLAQQARRPLVVIVEDLHWIDRTSEELLASLADGIVAARVLMLTTCRPGYLPPWTGRSHVTQIALGPLSAAESRRLVVAVLDAGAELPDSLVEPILARADGNPFFLEELARALQSRGEPSGVVMPLTVKDVLAARIDGLPAVDREVLQLAAVVGRDVPMRLLVEASTAAADDVRGSLGRLQSRELMVATRPGPEAQYAFKHALTHEAAYDSVPGEERATLHAHVAHAIETLVPDASERHPEVLARHFAAAGRPREAITHLRRAGQLAIRRSANAEAIAHLERALTLLEALPADATRMREELQVLVALAAALVAHRGFGSLELEGTLARLRVLAERAGYVADVMPVRFGLWRFALARADFDTAEQLATELRLTAERHPEPGLLVAADAAAGMTAFYLGDLPRARRHYEDVAARYEPSRERANTLVYGQDLGVGPLGYLGWTLTLMGEPDLGADTADRALALARASGHPFTIAHGLNIAGLVRCDRREPDRVAAIGDEMLALSREQRFPFLTSLALMLTGWARFALGDTDRGLAMMREGDAMYRGAHQRVGLRSRAQLAEALVAAGAVDEALAVAEEALAHAGATRDAIYRSEVLRAKGEALARRSLDDPTATACLDEAIDVATAQGATLLALRAATSLARLQRQRGAAVSAAATVRQLLGRFADGLDLADLRAAREQLS